MPRRETPAKLPPPDRTTPGWIIGVRQPSRLSS